jgi:hypothetical protein
MMTFFFLENIRKKDKDKNKKEKIFYVYIYILFFENIRKRLG